MKKTWIYIPVIAAMLLWGCEESFTREVAVPLEIKPAGADAEIQRISPLDVQAEVEKIVTAAGLKPHVENTQEADLFGVAEDLIEAPKANARTWKHPDFPLFLSMTRQKDEFLLLLNIADEKPNTEAIKLFKQLEKQLAALPVELIIPSEQKTSK